MLRRLGPVRSCALLAFGAAVLAEGTVADWFHVGHGSGFGWGRLALLVVGCVSGVVGLIGVCRGWRGLPQGASVVRALRSSAPFLIAVVVYFAAFHVMDPVATGDQPHYELDSMSLAYDQDFNLANNYTNPAQTEIMFGPSDVGGREAFAYTNRHALIPVENVGFPLVLAAAVPWVKLVESRSPNSARSPWNIEIIILAAFAAALLYRILRRLRPDDPGLTAAVWACTVFCAPMVVYASQIYPEIPALLLALITTDCLMRRPTAATGFVGASAASAMPWLHIRFFPVAVLLVLALAARAIAQLRPPERSSRSLIRAAWPVLVPFMVSVLALAFAFQAWYGSPWITAPYRLPQTRQPQTLVSSYQAIAGLLWSSQRGILPFVPVELLALGAIPLFCRRYGRCALFGVLVACVYALSVTIQGSNIEDSFPGRYLVWLLPFAAVPLLFLVTEFRLARWIFEVFAVVTACISLAVVLEPPITVSYQATSTSLWTWIVDLWPAIAPPPAAHGYADAAVVIALTLGLLLFAAGIYAAGSASRRGARSSAPRLTVGAARGS